MYSVKYTVDPRPNISIDCAATMLRNQHCSPRDRAGQAETMVNA